MEKEQKAESIDLGKLMQILSLHRKIVGGVVGGCTLIALVASFVLPKTYESTTLVQVRSSDLTGGASALAAAVGGGASQTLNYIELMKSRTVLDPIIDQMEWENEKKKPEAKDFAKKKLKIENTKQTNLITVTATGKTPEEAQMISQGVVDNFLAMQTEKSQQTQSLLVQFLNGRIEEAKKDAEDARTKFAEYQQKHKIYSPDEQAKAIVNKMNATDEALSSIAVQEKASQAKLDTVEAKLGDMRNSSQNLQINDNEVVMGLRKQIVSAQVELVTLREKYTEQHPSIKSTKEKIAALQQNLANEVNTVVASKYTTMNPTQASLIGEQANAQVSIAVAEASKAAIEARKAENEKKLEGFPSDVLEYLNLQRDTAIKEEIYTNLVKQCEQNKLEEARQSMDIQVIDSANLPDEDKPAGLGKKRITAIGFIIGVIISFVYGMIMYKRENN